MKNIQLILILLIPTLSSAQLAYLNNNDRENKDNKNAKTQQEVAAPQFLPKNSMDSFVKFDYKKLSSAVDLRWQFNKSMNNKTVHLLKGVMQSNHQIKWEIIKEYGPLTDEKIKFKFKDKTENDLPTYYRLRISEDGDMVEYTGFYKII